jgi:hypothetical protein
MAWLRQSQKNFSLLDVQLPAFSGQLFSIKSAKKRMTGPNSLKGGVHYAFR